MNSTAKPRILSAAEILGMLRIAILAPNEVRGELKDPKAALQLLERAIEDGDPSQFITGCTRETALNWAPRRLR